MATVVFLNVLLRVAAILLFIAPGLPVGEGVITDRRLIVGVLPLSLIGETVVSRRHVLERRSLLERCISRRLANDRESGADLAQLPLRMVDLHVIRR